MHRRFFVLWRRRPDMNLINNVKIKRIYEPPTSDDGYRVLVDRIWPRGISKEKAHLDEWAKSISPSAEIRKAFHHDADLMEEFKGKYLQELDNNEFAHDFVTRIRNKLEDAPVTLLYAAKDPTHNNAVILKEWLDQRL
jgi:uncharacterized protein YeaO (DUF488 family)